MRLTLALLLTLLSVPAWAQEVFSPSASGTQLGTSAQDLPIGDAKEPPATSPVFTPSEPASAAQIEAWRRDLVGRPAFSARGGRVGTVTELTVGLDNRAIAAVVTTESGARLSMPWYRVRNQLGKPTLVVPWSLGEIRWLTGG